MNCFPVRVWMRIAGYPLTFWLVMASSFVWLTAAVPFLSLYHNGVRPVFSPQNHGSQDFAQYYMGGAVVLDGAYDSMYPDAKEGLRANVGWPESSTPKPGYIAVAEKRGVEDSFRYMLPPPSALLFVPLALLPYEAARVVWVSLLGAACWGVCFFAYRMNLRCGGSRATGLFWCGFWSFSPLMLKALRTANSTPFVALALGFAAWGIFRNKRVLAVAGCIVAGLLKGTSLIFVPLILLMKRWGIIAAGALAAVVLSGGMILLAGTDVYREFFGSIYPSTRIPDPYVGNQSVFGFLYRCGGEESFSASVLAVKIAARLLGAVLVWRLWRTRKIWSGDYARFNSAVLVLLGLYTIFSAYCWEHYVLFYLPFWTVLWTRSRGTAVRTLLAVSAALMWFPLTVMRGAEFIQSEPFQSQVLWGQVLMLAAAVVDVFRKESIPTEIQHE